MIATESMNAAEQFAHQAAAELGEGWKVVTEYPVGIEPAYMAKRGCVVVALVVDDEGLQPDEIWADAIPNGFHGEILLEAKGETVRNALAKLAAKWVELKAPIDLGVEGFAA